MELQEIAEVISQVTNTYERRRIEEIVSSQTKAGRTGSDEVPCVVGKVIATRELRAQLYTAFGLTPS